MATRSSCFTSGGAGRRDRLERPPRLVGGGDAGAASCRLRRDPRPPRSPPPPLAPLAARAPICTQRGQVGDLPVRELLLRRHLQVVVLVADRLDQQALLRVAGDDDGAGLAAVHHAGLRVEPQVALVLLGAVAWIAVLGQERPDGRLEELDGGGVGLGRLCRRVAAGRSRCRRDVGRGHHPREPAEVRSAPKQASDRATAEPDAFPDWRNGNGSRRRRVLPKLIRIGGIRSNGKSGDG